jgi:hypothetical protein
MPPDKSDEATEPQVRPFADFLAQQAGGRTHSELSDQLHKLIGAVHDTGKKGKLQLTIEVKPLSKGDDMTLTVTDAVVVTMPKADRAQSVFFIDDTGNLSRNDPRQATLPLREIEDRRSSREATR